MEILAAAECVPDLACAACGASDLAADGGAATCARCGRSYPSRSGVLDFVLLEELDADGLREHAANVVDLASKRSVRRRVGKGGRNPLLMAQTERAIRVVDRLMAPYGEDHTLVSVGSGSAFELRSLLARRRFARVYSSDLAWTATALAPEALRELGGRLGLFAASFDHLPVRRRSDRVGLVYLALHHVADPHRTLERMLDENFDHLVLVEPITNRLVELLARAGLARRVEYTGMRPEWLRVKRLRRIARERGCQLRIETWWEIPRSQLPRRVRKSRRAWWPLYLLVEGLSWLTRPFRLGSMAAIRFSR
jgi:methyltransferase family protein